MFRGPFGSAYNSGLPSGMPPVRTGLPAGLIPEPPTGPRTPFANPLSKQSPTVLPSKTPNQLASYAKKLKAIYGIHNPDNVEKVDYLLQKYKAQEDYLYQSVCTKYCVDPDNLEESLGLEKGSLDVDEEPDTSAEPAKPQEKRTVMEWDSAKGAMVALEVEVDGITGITEEEALQKEVHEAILKSEQDSGADTRVSDTSNLPSNSSVGGIGLPSEDEDADDDEYDPFTTAPMSAADGEADAAPGGDGVDVTAAIKRVSQTTAEVSMPAQVQELVDIDHLLLGERSEFFERGLLGKDLPLDGAKRRRLL